MRNSNKDNDSKARGNEEKQKNANNINRRTYED